MNSSSKVNRAYQHSQRNKVSDGEYVRYREECDGRPYTLEEHSKKFIVSIIEVYALMVESVEELLEDSDRLNFFSRKIAERMNTPSLEITKPDGRGFSFCNYVAKRLVLLRKAGKLVRKKMLNSKPRENKPKKRVANAMGGSLVRKVE